MKLTSKAFAGVVAGAACTAAAQPTIDWWTVDCGGAGPNGALTGGAFSVSGTTGQPDAGTVSGGAFEIRGGFWFGGASGSPCYANCDASTGTPVLTPNDFQCFLDAYAAGLGSANCDGSTGSPILTPNDFQCFLNGYAAGCS